MKKNILVKVLPCLSAGGVLFALRYWQNRDGFAPETGLAVPSLPGKLLVGALVLYAVLELVLSRRLSREKKPFARSFRPPEKELPALILGCLALMAGGAFQMMDALEGGMGIPAIVTGVLAPTAGAGLLLMLRRLRSGEEDSVAVLLPAMFFGVFLLLSTYQSFSADPVLPRIYFPILAAAAVTLAFARLAGFYREESSPRSFVPLAHLASALSVGTLADDRGETMFLIFSGCAVIFAVLPVLLQGNEDE